MQGTTGLPFRPKKAGRRDFDVFLTENDIIVFKNTTKIKNSRNVNYIFSKPMYDISMVWT